VLAVTVTFSVPVEVRLPSLTWRVKLALVAVQLATISAVIAPFVFTIFERVTPLDGLALVTATTSDPAALSLSLTVAMVEFEIGLPCCLVTLAGVIVGVVLTSSAPMS
jgi:hypothetical protein